MNTIPSKLLSRGLLNKYGKLFLSDMPPKNDNIWRNKFLKYFAISGALATILSTVYFSRSNKRHLSQFVSQSNDMTGLEISSKGREPDSMRDQFNFIDKVVKKCASAVFYLEIRDPYKKDPETGEAVITSNGSGFIISKDGWALTNAHVVLNKPQSTVTAIMRDGRSFPVQVEDADLNIDLALLKLTTDEPLPQLQFAKSGDADVGEWVVALGSPLSLSNSVTVGIVSCVDRPSEELGLKNYSMKYIQTDASITFGNSGGPLVNLDGHVIGINNLRLTSGISFAIPVEYVKKFLENSKFRLKQEGFMGKTLLGITTISIRPEAINGNCKIPDNVKEGLLVWKVIEGTVAHRSGLEIGDIITHINGIAVKEAGELYSLSRTGRTITIDVVKRGKKIQLTMDTSALKDL